MKRAPLGIIAEGDTHRAFSVAPSKKDSNEQTFFALPYCPHDSRHQPLIGQEEKERGEREETRSVQKRLSAIESNRRKK